MKFLASFVAILALVELSTQQTNYCDPNLKLCSAGVTHIACHGLTSLSAACGAGAQEVTLDASKQALIVDLHNKLRSTIASGNQINTGSTYYPQASRMATLQWDADLASIAAANARSCKYGHDQCRNTPSYPAAGQNIAIKSYYGQTFTVESLITGFVNGWYSEFKDANPSVIASYPSSWSGSQIGHFTQIVSDRTTRVGCSMVTYMTTDANKQQWINQYFVCNYALTNIVGQPVYVTGPACSKCTTGCNKSYAGLCNTNENISPKP